MNAVIALLFGFLAVEGLNISNPGFEELDARSGLPTHWSFTTMPGQQNLVRYEVKTADDAGATKALAIHVAADHPRQTVAYNAHQDITGVTAGKKYRVSADVRTEKLATLPMIVVQCIGTGDEKPLAFFKSPPRKLSADIKQWENIETVVTVPENTRALRLRIGIPAEDNAGGTMWLDNVAITEIQ